MEIVKKNSTGQSQLYDSVAKINFEAELITDTKESQFLLQILYTNTSTINTSVCINPYSY
jgi:hypothetical protein